MNSDLDDEAYVKLKEFAAQMYEVEPGIILDVAEISIKRVKFVSGGVDYIANGQAVVLVPAPIVVVPATPAPVQVTVPTAPVPAVTPAVNVGSALTVPVLKDGVEGALARASEQVLKNIPEKSKIAIVYISAPDKGTTDFITGELEYMWVNKGYFISDRSQLDRLREEQSLQLGGEVDETTAVSIGKTVGANIIVTGKVDGEGDLRRLRLRVLDVQTAQVIGVASEKL